MKASAPTSYLAIFLVGAHALMSPQKKEICEAYKNLAEQGL